MAKSPVSFNKLLDVLVRKNEDDEEAVSCDRHVLLSAGSLKALQTASIAASLPFLFIMIAMVPALMKELAKDKLYDSKDDRI